MDSNEENNSDTCRLCMELGACVSIFEAHKRFPIALSKMINICVGLSLLEDEELPKTICNTCGYLLIIFYNYKNLCVQSDTKLRAALVVEQDQPVVNFEGVFLTSKPSEESFIPESSKSPEFFIETINLGSSNFFLKNEVVDLQDEQLGTNSDEMNDDDADEDWDDENVDDEEWDNESTSELTNVQSEGDESAVQSTSGSTDVVAEFVDYAEPTDADFEAVKDNVLYSCKCKMEFDSWEPLKTHVELNLNKDCVCIFKCKLCYVKYFSLPELGEHIAMHNLTSKVIKVLNSNRHSTNLKCHLCLQLCPDKKSLMQHFVKHGVKVQYCNKCNVGYQKYHQCSSSARKTYFCSECSKKFKTKRNFLVHMTHHYYVKTGNYVSCLKCSKTFGKIKFFLKHVATHVLTEDEAFTCSYCPKKFNSKSYLKRHMNVCSFSHVEEDVEVDIETVDDESKKSLCHNLAERVRRLELSSAKQFLRMMVPATRAESNASTVKVISSAKAYCDQLTAESKIHTACINDLTTKNHTLKRRLLELCRRGKGS